MPIPAKRALSLEQCHFSVHDNDQTLTGVLSYYGTLRSYIQHEDDLINTRLTWSLTVHGFLFAIYGVMLGKVADILVELYKQIQAHHLAELQKLSDPRLVVAPFSPAQLERTILLLVLFQIPVSGFGAWVGYRSGRAIRAAHQALLHLQVIAHTGLFTLNAADCSTLSGKVLLPKIVDGGRREAPTGSTPLYYVSLPFAAMAVWILLLGASLFTLICQQRLFDYFLNP